MAPLPSLCVTLSLSSRRGCDTYHRSVVPVSYFYLFLKILFIYFREKGKEGERERGKHQCERDTLISCLSRTPAGDLAGNPGMCPDRELNRESLVLRPALSALSHSSQGLFLVYSELCKHHSCLIPERLTTAKRNSMPSPCTPAPAFCIHGFACHVRGIIKHMVFCDWLSPLAYCL